MLHTYENGTSEICCDRCMAENGIAKKAVGRYKYGRCADELCESCFNALRDEDYSIIELEKY